jgi:hypothetical protein
MLLKAPGGGRIGVTWRGAGEDPTRRRDASDSSGDEARLDALSESVSCTMNELVDMDDWVPMRESVRDEPPTEWDMVVQEWGASEGAMDGESTATSCTARGQHVRDWGASRR